MSMELSKMSINELPWRQVSKRTVRPKAIVFLSPALDNDLSLHQGIQDLPIEKLIPKLPDIGLNIAVFLGASGLDVERGYAKVSQPAPDRVRYKLGTVIGSDISRDTPRQEQSIELVQDVFGPDPSGYIRG